ncbi:metallophosphoesterase family protein [Sphingobium sp.]|uniref:Metallophosphoesterase n=1 Tax=Sphingobium psychrophilum TaxID=2728834 RepID=A0A7X9WZJ2_9SPHN|nr:metallophosphoesterase [Sphingobium psychrophilum]
MLPRLRILQVGDVHLARTAKLGLKLDEKDRRFPLELRNRMAGGPIKTVFRRLHQFLEQDDFAFLLFMGDLAEQGDLNGFRACVRYLAEALQLGKGRRFEALKVGIVPGNHDIDRVLAAKPSYTTKFTPLQQAMTNAGLPLLPVDKPIWLDHQKGPCRIDVALLNSCWGCGSPEYIPEEFRDEIVKAINSALTKGVDEKATRSYYDRQLDTPAFSKNTVQGLVEGASKLPGGSLIIACAHHNILPQRLPRLAPYTELVNSGAIRSELSKLGRPVLYLHGHIHEDPVEIIQTSAGAPLVCISAPEASEGFNVVEIVFTPAGLPLSCYIEPWRFAESGVFAAMQRQVIPIGAGRRRPPNAVVVAIYQQIIAEQSCFWGDMMSCAQKAGATHAADATEEALELLTADQLVTIEHHELGREHWLVRSRL